MGEIPKELSGILAKLQRANESIDYLEQEFDLLSHRNTTPHITRREKKGNVIEISYHVSAKIEVPLRLAVITGEVIHQLRSSLDHLVGALAVKAGDKIRNTHEFPACRTVESFTKALNSGKIHKVGAAAEKRIEKEQPFKVAIPETHYLSILHDLDVIDKHRLLLVIAAVAAVGDQITFTGELSSPAKVVLADGFWTPKILSEHDTEVCRFSVSADHAALEAQVDISTFVVFPDFGGRAAFPVLDALKFLRDAVEGCVAEFKDLFS